MLVISCLRDYPIRHQISVYKSNIEKSDVFVFVLQSKTRVGFMTYDSKINFYNINGAKLSQPQQMTVGDVLLVFIFVLYYTKIYYKELL